MSRMNKGKENKKCGDSHHYTPRDKMISKPFKRKYNEMIGSDISLSTQKLDFIKGKIDEIYEKFVDYNTTLWKEEFIFELKQENIVDISDTFPKSLNTKGSLLLEYTKFWILFIAIKLPLDLETFVKIFNHALNYEQSDMVMFNSYYVRLIKNNFDNKMIHSMLVRINGVNKVRVPENEDDLTIGHYRFLLDKPEMFNELNLKAIISPFTSKEKKTRSELSHFLHSTQTKPVVINETEVEIIKSNIKERRSQGMNTSLDFRLSECKKCKLRHSSRDYQITKEFQFNFTSETPSESEQ